MDKRRIKHAFQFKLFIKRFCNIDNLKIRLRSSSDDQLEGEEDGQREDDRSLIWEFLDLSSSKEKMDFLQKKKSEITEEFIGIAAQSLDFVENDGTVEERYEAVMQYLRTVMRYESGRLR